MTSDTAGRARTRPQSTDLDVVNPARRLFSLAPSQSSRFALHLVQETLLWPSAGNRSLESSPKHPPPEVLSARSTAGFRGFEPSAFMYPAQRLVAVQPRGVAWTDFPVVAMPVYRLKDDNPVPVYCPLDVTHSLCPVDKLPERVDTVFVHLPHPWNGPVKGFRARTLENLAKAETIVSALHPDTSVILVSGTEVIGGAPELRALVAGDEAMLRFAYSYGVNFDAIAVKALEHALGTPDPKALALHKALFSAQWRKDPDLLDTVRNYVKRRECMIALRHPYALQVLYGLKRRGNAPLTRDVVDWRDHDLIWQKDLFFDKPEEPLWIGTGKYEPVKLAPTLVTNIAHDLAFHMLLCQEGRNLCLSPTGQAFLDSLHPDCEDLDLPMRWTHSPLTDADREAMDAWITRRFRRMKKGVNALDGVSVDA